MNVILQGITTAPILFALQEEPFMQTLINRKFSEEGDSRMVKLAQSLILTFMPSERSQIWFLPSSPIHAS